MRVYTARPMANPDKTSNDRSDSQPGAPQKGSLTSVIAASSVGTLIEWYDFYIFGSLSAVLAKQFFPPENATLGYISTLALFATGFIVRPFGALVFGRIGDLVGRKYAFLMTLLMMGGSTFAIGLIPGYAQIGVLAPMIVLLLRLTQGLALGGEYGGAATYVAEHSPDDKRGLMTSYIQTTATLGFFVSILVILGLQSAIPKAAFEDWGWRIPFLLSALLVVVSYSIRRKLQESPLFQEMKSQGAGSKNPLKDSFGNAANLKLVALALFGATMGQGVVWYTGQFYAQAFMAKVLNIESIQTNTIIAVSLLLATPLFIVFGALSDKVGRKKLMMAGCFLAAVCYVPIFNMMAAQANIDSKTISLGGMAQQGEPKVDVAKKDDAEKQIKAGDIVTETTFLVTFSDGSSAKKVVRDVRKPDSNEQKTTSSWIDKKLNSRSVMTLIGLVFILVTFVTMFYGPIAAFLVELFPTKIRYSSMSLPYHIGNGVFGGLVPVIAISMVSATHSPIAGLYYPVGIAVVTFVIGSIFLPDRRGVRLSDDTV